MGATEEILSSLTERGWQKVRFAPGVVGKSSMMWLGTIGIWAIILAKLSADNLVFDAILFGVGVIVTFAVARETGKMRSYAAQNPNALLEGAQLLAYKEIEARSKELPAPDNSPPSTSTGSAVIPTSPDTDGPQ
jgi:hypothetical protein